MIASAAIARTQGGLRSSAASTTIAGQSRATMSSELTGKIIPSLWVGIQERLHHGEHGGNTEKHGVRTVQILLRVSP